MTFAKGSFERKNLQRPLKDRLSFSKTLVGGPRLLDNQLWIASCSSLLISSPGNNEKVYQ